MSQELTDAEWLRAFADDLFEFAGENVREDYQEKCTARLRSIASRLERPAVEHVLTTEVTVLSNNEGQVYCRGINDKPIELPNVNLKAGDWIVATARLYLDRDWTFNTINPA